MIRIPLKRQAVLPLLLTLLLCGLILPSQAQTFSSGSTGADGAFSPTTSQTVQVPASGVFNFTTVSIPANITITFAKNAKNTPITMLASGNIAINGAIDISGRNGSTAPNGAGGGPGGFDGGDGGGVNSFGTLTYYGASGDGPGGGGGGQGSADGSGVILGGGGGGGYSAPGFTGAHRYYDGPTSTDGLGGPFYGSTSLLQLIGGSGGGGGGSVLNRIAGGGGGGGGAIVIASSGTISFGTSSAINAAGGIGGQINISASGTVLNGGGGAGGAIRLVATTLTGSPTINVSGGRSGIDFYNYPQLSGRGGGGFARFEAYNFSVFTPNVTGPFLSNLAPTSVMLSPPPTLTITSVGGVAAPPLPKGDFNAPPDITLPSSAANPVTALIAAANIPLGTVLSVEVTPQTGTKTFVSSTPLAGKASASSAAASITLPAAMMSVLIAAATINLSSTQTSSLPPLIINGERIKSLVVAATFGGASQTTYITESGRRYSREQLLGPVREKVTKK